MKTFVYISFGILIIFGFIGAILTGMIFHERSHMSDYRNINKTYEELCYFDYDGVCYLNSGIGGYYNFNLQRGSQREEILRIREYTEPKAYAIAISIAIVFVVSCLIISKYIILDSYRDERG